MKIKKIIMLVVLSLLFVSCTNTNNKAEENNKNIEKKNMTAQEESGEHKKIGVIQLADHIALERSRTSFEEEIKNLDKDVEIISKNANGDLTVVPTIIKNFVDEDVDLIYAIATPAAQGAKNGAGDIPIVFSAVTDPVSADLVKNIEEPEANVTGVSDYFSVKAQLEEALEVFPDIKNVGVLFSTNEANSKFQIEELNKAASDLGLEVIEVGINNINDVSTAMKSMENKIDLFFGIQDNTVSSAASIIAESLKSAKIPSVASEQGPVENGILMSTGVDYESLGKVAANMAHEIINGKKVSEVPVAYSTEVKKIVNETTADALGLSDNEKLTEDADLVK